MNPCSYVVSHRIHVCHIWSHLPSIYPSHVSINLPYMDPMGMYIYRILQIYDLCTLWTWRGVGWVGATRHTVTHNPKPTLSNVLSISIRNKYMRNTLKCHAKRHQCHFSWKKEILWAFLWTNSTLCQQHYICPQIFKISCDTSDSSSIMIGLDAVDRQNGRRQITRNE